MEILRSLINAEFVASIFRISTPLILCALGGLLCMKASIFNIGLEGFMLVGTFFAILFVDLSGGNVYYGLLGGMIAGIIISLIYAVFVIWFKTDVIVAGIAINLLALGITDFLPMPIWGTLGGYRPPVMDKLPGVQIPVLTDLPFFGDALFNHNPVVYFTLLMVVVTYIVLFRTPFGLAIQTVGEHPLAAKTSGINPQLIMLLVIIWSGALSGLAGTHLSTGIISEFTENMVQGRGFTAFTAIVFGNNHPIYSFLACLLFGFADAIGIRLELGGIGLPTTIIKTFPYLISIIVLGISSARRHKSQAGLMIR